jgi:GT2 family glycosyltransferase
VSSEPEVSTSVVIPAFEASATLPLVLEALAPQLHSGREAVLVESTLDGRAAGYERRWPWLDVITLPRRALPGEARNIGVRHARGRLIAFLDADAVPGADWLDRLEQQMTDDVDAVCGSVVNGTPHSAVGTAEYLLEFSEWMPSRRKPLQHAATCNLLVRRRRFESQGGLAEDLRAGEDTAFTFPIAAEGRLGFAPHATVRHLNRTGVQPFLANQRRLGVGFVEVCRRVPLQHRWVCRGPGVTLAIPLRLLALLGRLRTSRADARRALAAIPAVTIGLLAWLSGVLSASRAQRRRRS